MNSKYIKRFDKIMHVASRHVKEFKADIEALFPKGITSTELSIIKCVSTQPDIIIKEISESLSLPGSTLTSAIDRLEERQLIKRVMSKRNKRSFGLELTPEGIEINKIHEKAEKVIWNKILGALNSDEEREVFLTLLETISKEL